MGWRGNGLGAIGQVSDPRLTFLPTPWTNPPQAHCPHVLRPQVPSKLVHFGEPWGSGGHAPAWEARVPACPPHDAFRSRMHSGPLGEIETTHGSVCLQMSIKCWLCLELGGLGGGKRWACVTNEHF